MYLILYGDPFEILYFSIHQHAALCKEKCALVETKKRQVSEGTHGNYYYYYYYYYYVFISSSIRKEILQC